MRTIKDEMRRIGDNVRIKNIKLQSAIEYLVTYGWAILIIAIVLFVIFNSGLLNPQKPTYCVTSSDFSCPVYNFNASSGKLTINLYQYTSSPINITAFGCNTNKTLPEMQIPYNPRAIVYYIPITIENSQPSPTPAPFQQMVNITESNYAQYITYNSNFANFEYFYANGTIIPAWIESNQSGKLITWVKLANGIPKSSSITIYLGFANKTANLLSSSGTSGIGEAPQLSSTYAEYDDGVSVFNFYDNFAGTSLNTNKWTNEGITYTLNNGFTATSTAASGYIYSPTQVTPPNVIEFYGNLGGQSTSTTAETGGIMIPATNNGNFWGVAIGSGWPTSGSYLAQMTNNGAISDVVLSGAFQNAVLTIDIVNSITSTYTYNYVNKVTVSADAPSYPVKLMLIGAPASAVAYSFSPDPFIQWFRTRAYPPNGAMPSVTFGSAQSIIINIPSSIEYYVPINITNSQTSSTPSPFQQMVNITESSYSSYINYNNNFANFEYFYANGTVIPAWIESNQSGKLITWIKINPSIPASGKLTVYLGFASTSANLLSSSGTSGIGEAPQLSSTYAEYDDGASVFNFYDNFAGTSLNTTKWSNVGSSGTSGSTSGITVNNGLTLTGGGAGGLSHQTWIRTSLSSGSFNNALVIDVYENSPSTSTTFRGGFTNSNPTYFGGTSTQSFGEQIYEDGNWYTDTDNGASSGTQSEIGSWASLANTYVIWSIAATSSQVLFYNPNTYSTLGTSGQTITTTIPAYSSSIGLSLTNEYTNPIYVKWVRVRAYPPSGTMPSISFGSVGNSASSAPFIVTLSPHQVTIPINSNYTLTMQCYNNGTIASVPSGQIFDGYFFVNYTSLNNGFHQTLVGDVAAKAT